MNSVLERFRSIYESDVNSLNGYNKNSREFLLSLDSEKREFIETYEFIKALEKENSEIANRNYEDEMRRADDMRAYASIESSIITWSTEIERLRREINNLNESVSIKDKENAELDGYESSFIQSREKFEKKEAMGTLTDADKEELRKYEEALKYSRITKLRNDQENKITKEKVQDLENQLSGWAEFVDKMKAQQAKIRENQKNGYIDEKAKKKDEMLLEENKALIEENLAKLKKLSGIQEDEKAIPNVTPQTNNTTDPTTLGDAYSVDHLNQDEASVNNQVPPTNTNGAPVNNQVPSTNTNGETGIVNNQVPPTSGRKVHEATGLSKTIADLRNLRAPLTFLGVAVSAMTGVGLPLAILYGVAFYGGSEVVFQGLERGQKACRSIKDYISNSMKNLKNLGKEKVEEGTEKGK